MAKKVSTLVVPVKLDTSGMNAGLNEMKSKISRAGRGSGGGVGGGGGGGGGFSSGITPFGVGGGSGSAAAAMAAAFGASMGGRGGGGKPGVLWGRDPVVGDMEHKARMAHNRSTYAGRFFQFTADIAGSFASYHYNKNRNVPPNRRVPAFNRRMSLSNMSDMFYNQIYNDQNNAIRQRNQARGDEFRLSRDSLQILATNATNITNRLKQSTANKLSAVAKEDFGGAVGALYAGERLLRSISPVGIAQTMGNLKPFENRAAGQYDIAQGMRNRAMTASTGNIGMGQQFFLGVGNAAGGKKSRVEQMGGDLYEGLGVATGFAGGLLEKGLNFGLSLMEDAVVYWGMNGRGGGSRTNVEYFNMLKRVYN